MAELTPPLNRHNAPPFYEMTWQDFQLFSRELLSRDRGPGICFEYGKNGQAQHGIDLKKDYDGQQFIDVAQCKCFRTVGPEDVRRAVKAFREHLRLWKAQHVDRFILLVACDVSDAKVLAAIREQRKALGKVKIEFQVWGARQLEDKLRPHRDIADTYCGPEWGARICRSALPHSPNPDNASLGMQAIVAQLGELSLELTEAHKKELDRLFERSRQHRFADVLAGLHSLKGSKSWTSLTAAFRSRVLRFEATTVINHSADLALAETLIAEARKIDPSGDFQVVDAYLAYRRHDRGSALRLLDVPKSLNAFNLRLGLWLEEGRIDDVITAVTAPSPNWSQDAETHRYAVYAYLLKVKLDDARYRMNLALETGSTHPPVREALALLSYFSAISPAFGNAFRHLPWPIPVPWSFVKRDRSSVDSLTRAAEIFGTLASEPTTNPEDQRKLQRWRIAALACLISEQGPAADAIRQRLKDDAADVMAIIWALDRGYDFDRAASEAALLTRLDANPGVEECMAVASLRFYSDDYSGVQKILLRHQSLFESAGNRTLWDAQMRMAKIGVADATDELISAKDLGDSKRTVDPIALFQVCETKLRTRDWPFIADRAEQLVTAVATEPALRLALHGLFRAERHDKCLELLEKNRALLPDGVLSSDLAALRIECRCKLGHVSEALKEAQENFVTDVTFERMLHLFQIQVAAADSFGALATARQALVIPNVPPGFYIEAAHLLGQFDRTLATQLWRKGFSSGIDRIGNIKLAYETAIGLGLDREAAPLMSRIMALAREGKGGVVALTLAQAREQLDDASRAAEDVWQTYARGQVPAHLASAQTHLSLGQLYHSIPHQNRLAAQPYRHFPAFFRSANRSHKESGALNSGKGQLHVDITGLLLAHEMGLLPLVEQQFGPLQISPHLTQSLFREIERAGHHQISRPALASELLKLVRVKKLAITDPVAGEVSSGDLLAAMGKEWCQRLAEAHGNGGAIVDYLPLRSNTDELLPISLTDRDAPKVWGIADCIRLLHLTGKLAAQDYDAAIASLPERAPPKSDDLLRRYIGRPIHLLGNVWESLATNTWFESLCEICRVSIDRSEADAAERLQDRVAHKQEVVVSLQQLLQRVNLGITTGVYQTTAAAKPPARYPGKRTPEEAVLLDLISAGGKTSGYAWADDRMLSRFRFCGPLKMIGVWEVLQALRTSGSLVPKEYFEKLDWLRRSNIRYFPVLAEEISHQIKSASLDGATLVETRELAALRRYVAACLLDRERLQPPHRQAPTVRQLHDFTFLLELQSQVQDALMHCWSDFSIPVERQEAEANWVWNNLYFDVASFRQLLGAANADIEVAEHTVVSLGALFMRGLMLTSPLGAADSPRKRYLNWLHSSVVQPFLHSNSPTRTALARAIGGHVRTALGNRYNRSKPKERKIMSLVLQRFVMDLPDDLVAELGLSTQEWDRVGITLHGPTVNIGDFSFDASTFWSAAAKALSMGRAEITPREDQTVLVLTPASEDSPHHRLPLQLVDIHGKRLHLVRDHLHPLLSEKEADRRSFLTQKSHIIEGSVAQRAATIDRIAQLQSHADRMLAAQVEQSRSLTHFYRALANQVSANTGFSLDELCPADWQQVLVHLTIDPAAPDIDFRQTMQGLLAAEGLAVTVERLSCLPLALDEKLIAAFNALSTDEARNLAKDWDKRLRSPVQLLHLLRLHGLLAVREPTSLTRAKEILEHLLSGETAAKEFDCFHALLRIVRRSVNSPGSSVRSAPAQSLLVNWYHASRLFSILVPSAGPSTDLIQFFASAAEGWTADVFDRAPGYWEDIAHPQHVSRGNVLLHGLDAVFRSWPEAVASQLDIPERIGREMEKKNHLARRLQLAFVADWSLFQNALGTFLSTGTMRAVIWTENIEPVLSGDLASTVAAAQRYIAEIQNGDTSQAAWVRLFALLGDAPIPPELHEPLKKLVGLTDIPALRPTNRSEAHFLLRSLARMTRQLGDDALLRRMEDQLFALAQNWSAIGPLGRDEVQSLLDALLSLTVKTGAATESAREFFARCQRLLQFCPDAANALKDQSGSWLAQLPIEQQGALWPFIMHVRAMAN